MFHPFSGNVEELTDQELQDKLEDVTRKWYAAHRFGNPNMLTQLETFVTIYRDETTRRSIILKAQQENDLDQLINVD
jgi:hypothetical protein